MGWGRGVEEGEFLEDEPGVNVDVAAYGEEGDSSVGGAESGDVGLFWVSMFAFWVVRRAER